MRFKEINAVYSYIHLKQINKPTLFGQKVELFIIKADGTYKYH
jgi:hypothetical protein